VSAGRFSLFFVKGKRRRLDSDGALWNNRTLLYGDGLFETLRIENRHLPLLPYHLQRLQRGMDILGLNMPLATIQKQIALFLEEHAGSLTGLLRVQLARSAGFRGSYPDDNSADNVDTLVSYVPRDLHLGWYQPAVSVKQAKGKLADNPALSGIKHCSRLNYLVAAKGEVVKEDEELIFMDEENRLIETMHHNFFCVIDGVLCTPSVERSGVAGVLREVVLSTLTEKERPPVQVRDIYASELPNATEIFLTNAVMGIVPVQTFNQQPIPTGCVGEKIAAALNRRFAREIEAGPS